MFKRHQTDPTRDIASVVTAFHDRLAGSRVTTRTDPLRIDPRNLRLRLGTPAGGLRDRIDRRLRTA
ncbi:MAG: hypothetical protein H0V73_06050 [Chloroflexi bacterium]|nr:hypothetical protein [Chloroflexota bacterium]